MNTFTAMLREITFSEYLALSEEVPLIDVRSPGEYQKGHIPGATNIPLFTNDERAQVGTVYKQKSKEQAIELGYKLVTPKFEWFISESQKVAPSGTVAVHCWRGGMRSKSFAQHLSEYGFNEVYVISGGYKAFRNHAHQSFQTNAEMCILGGYTGSAKTYILRELKEMGQQVIDLEGLANHKGSAFGGIGNGGQPTIEQFENNLFWEWKDLNYGKTIWIEDESHRIGLVNIPMNFFENMRSQPVIFLDIKREERARHLVNDYARADKAALADSINRIAKRLGGLDTKLALAHLEANEFFEVAMITLKYYDKYYLRGLQNRDHDHIYPLELTTINFKQNAKQILKHYATIGKTKHKTYAV
ncbi:tRNA 2-selenouridine(34) synthase MnmH [Prolixibacteraceae bacterium Z1-6]|uniref:tRNA 2-selenouridine(34) synthase MnmH n=1 Tax=Draconibacterium aestuarii TaxID=2998507 RepID=A0A9X3J8J8_9BACT|nr:tRNA 2-selenouridine(34) synthase MnmH [Prolixibacteraceae bacterium Z1-6]